MTAFNKGLLHLVLLSLAVSGCTMFTSKPEEDCLTVVVASYALPVAANLDYSQVAGTHNQVLTESVFQHTLSLANQKTASQSPYPTITSLRPGAAIAAPSTDKIRTVYFAFDSTALSGIETAKLDQFINEAHALGRVHIRITGHTDSSGGDAYNQTLSTQRADAVKRYLIARGIDSSTLMASGMGEQAPATSNVTALGRANNRRSELYPYTGK
jgi:outer membrane protein OmpA-like peptidoglycan-associated protein